MVGPFNFGLYPVRRTFSDENNSDLLDNSPMDDDSNSYPMENVDIIKTYKKIDR